MNSPNVKMIAFYFANPGVEASIPFESEDSYENARVFLSQLADIHLTGNSLPGGFLPEVKDYYFIDEQNCAEVWKYLQENQARD
jgi:hypothetical protein